MASLPSNREATNGQSLSALVHLSSTSPIAEDPLVTNSNEKSIAPQSALNHAQNHELSDAGADAINSPDAHGTVGIDADVNIGTDSAVGSEGGFSDTTSITSSLMNYRYENGRTYHAYRDGQYIMPNDEREQDRLDLVHHIWRLILRGALYHAPISRHLQRVLDVGTGTGIWAMEFADEFPAATVVANDLSPIQPTWVPPNLSFEVDDVEDGWLHYQPFDFIHIRNMDASIADWRKLCRQSYQHMRPGAWIEVQEHAIEMHSEDREVPENIRLWLEQMEGAARTFGKEMNVAKQVRGFMEDAGFKEIREDKYKIPLGTWAKDERMKEIGMFQQTACIDSVEAYSLALFTRVLGWDLARLQVYLAAVRSAFRDSHHLYIFAYVVYGRKPLHQA